MLFGTWAFGLVVGFALLHWSLHTPLTATAAGRSALSYGYFSGDTFFTLGYGDLTPTEAAWQSSGNRWKPGWGSAFSP